MQTIDYRNGRYQGEVLDRQPNGLGAFLHESQLFCIARWHRGYVDGPCFLLFPDGKIFFGSIQPLQTSNKSKATEEACSFKLKDGTIMYIKNNRKESVVFFPHFKLLLKMQGMSQEQSVVGHESCSLQKFYQRTTNLLSLSVPPQNWISFLKTNFASKQLKLIDILQFQKERKILIKVKIQNEQALGVELQEQQIITKINTIGSFNQFNKNGSFSFNYALQKSYSSNKLDQTHMIQSSKAMKKCLMSSLYFIDSFFKIDSLLVLQQLCLNLNMNLVTQTQQVAQIRIQLASGATIGLVQVAGVQKTIFAGPEPSPQRQFALQDVKDDIYRSAQKAKNTSPDQRKAYKQPLLFNQQAGKQLKPQASIITENKSVIPLYSRISEVSQRKLYQYGQNERPKDLSATTKLRFKYLEEEYSPTPKLQTPIRSIKKASDISLLQTSHYSYFQARQAKEDKFDVGNEKKMYYKQKKQNEKQSRWEDRNRKNKQKQPSPVDSLDLSCSKSPGRIRKAKLKFYER